MKSMRWLALVPVGVTIASIWHGMAQPDGILLAQAGKLTLIFGAFGLAALLRQFWWTGIASLAAAATLLVLAFNLPSQPTERAAFRWAQYQLPASNAETQLAFAQQLAVDADVLAISTTDASWNDTLCQALCQQFPYTVSIQQSGQHQFFFSAHPIAETAPQAVRLQFPTGDVFWTGDSLSPFPGANAICWRNHAGPTAPNWQAAAAPEWHQRLNPLASGVSQWLLSGGCTLAQQLPLETMGIATEAACWEFQFQPVNS